MMNATLLKSRIEAAEEQLEIAEKELNMALETLKVSAGGENIMVTHVIVSAFDRLKAAKSHVADLKQLLESDAK